MLPNYGRGRKKGHVEIYQAAHYLTITGQRLEAYPATVEVRADKVDCFHKKHFCETDEKKKSKNTKQKSRKATELSDDEIIALATKAANGTKFKKLMDGDYNSYPSQSEADEALCCILAFYTSDEAQIERIWARSGLSAREKFQRDDYRERTIREALETVKEHYNCEIVEAGVPAGKAKIKKSVATKLVELAKKSDCEFWHTLDKEPYISFSVDGHRENYQLKSKAVKRWLSKQLYDAEGSAAGAQALQDAINNLEAIAAFDGPEYSIFVRVGEYNGSIYVDLCDDQWRAVEINPSGWKIVECPPIRFKRSKGMLPLPEPVGGGSLNELKPFLNITNENTWILIKAIIVGAFHPKGPYPVTIFGGEQGSAKSTAQKILRSLIDPNEAPLRRPPKDEHDLMIAASNGWIMSFDNLSGIPNNLSDALCVLSTGGALSTRELYTDTEETILSARRPIFLNGIDSIPNRHDLLDRAIILTLPQLKEEQRRMESEIMGEFDRVQPRVLGAIFNAIAMGLQNLPTTQLARKPRMADFAVWATACDEGLDGKPGSFLEAYTKAVDDAILDTLSADSLAQTIILVAKYNKPAWSGTATQLLDKINILSGFDVHRPPMGWPQTGSALSNKLNRLAPALRKVWIEIDFKRKAIARIITIKEVNDGMTANDGEFNEGRHNDNHIQETLTKAIKGHNDGDDGVLTPLICGEKEKEEGEKDAMSKERVGEKDRHGRHGVICGVADSESDMTANTNGAVISCEDSVTPLAKTHPGTSLNADLQLCEEGKKEWEEHFRTPDSKKANCPICGDDISPGHSSRTFEGIDYCISCPTHFTMILDSVRELTEKNNGLGPTTTEIFEDVAGRGSRLPKKEHLPGMLRARGHRKGW